MNKKIKKLAKQADFVFWSKEPWGPGPNYIDWGADYTREFNRFVQSLVAECSDIAVSQCGADKELVEKNIKDYFKD
ncbi:hypothetical protein UFOVP116_166 [uncultured Caudovirales phage]|uniref:Uncharacterized protein n=1 Tax=uncultured Caudovirales phage TaxID=2100421 RepID=A0A6J5L9A3_9CAUD|nr:hypothetical protein UFOVP116_166 [uncultured Caudovirales phage]